MKKVKLIGSFILGTFFGIAVLSIVSFIPDKSEVVNQKTYEPKYLLDDGTKVYQIFGHTSQANLIVVTNPNGGVAAYPEQR